MKGFQISSTKKNSYQLDIATETLIKNIKTPIIITLFRSNNLNISETRFANKIEEVLKAYQNYADTTLNIDIVNPNESLETELDATNAGIKSIEIRGADKTLRKIFLGMIIQVGSRIEVLPIINPQMSIEYLVSSSLRKLTETHRRKIAYIKGHHEPSLRKIQGVEKLLRPNYDLTPIKLNTSLDISEYESVVIVAPYIPFTDEELNTLNAFLEQGKNIFLAIDRVGYDPEAQEAFQINSRLENWLRRKGILVPAEFIVDNSCGDVQLESVLTPITFPYFPQITDFSIHPINSGIDIAILKYASPIIPMTNIVGKYTPLARTSSVSGIKGLPLHINLDYEWSIRDYNAPHQTVAALLEIENNKKKDAKIVVVSDADIVLDNKNMRNIIDNHRFIANAIDWLSDSLGLVLIKQKGIRQQDRNMQIKPIRSWVRFLNVLFPLFIIGLSALYFLYFNPRRKSKKYTIDL